MMITETLYGIVDIDELMLQTQIGCEPFTQGLDTKTFCSVMTAGKERHPRFACDMHLLLGYLTGQIEIHTEVQDLLEQALRRTCAPGNAAQFPMGFAH